MNFFEHQARARRSTWLLTAYFALAVVLIVAAVDAIVFAAGYLRVSNPSPALMDTMRAVVFWTSLGTLGMILLGTLFKMSALSSGGGAVAALMGGVPVPLDTRDPAERRLQNVVEEMSIAAGIPVPALYVLPGEEGINAFAAGLSPGAAAVAVSRGALDALTRDELQGVVAHEFSHIFNGDMRMNVRLIGLLHGILMISIVGELLMRGSRSGRGKGGGAALIGLGIYAVGSIGLFFSQLIKAAISRQREFLADASAVQFTRNPSGILGALHKIRDGAGSRLTGAGAQEVSHLLFAQGLSSLFATHPPIEERIRAVDPNASFRPAAERAPEARPAAEAPAAAFAAPAAALPAVLTPAAVPGSVGQVDAAALEAARRILREIPAALRSSLETAPGARASAYALLLDGDMDLRRRQLALLGGEAAAAAEALNALAPLGARGRLPVLELAAPALRGMPPAERGAFLGRVRALVSEDGRTVPGEALLEACILRAVDLRLAPSGHPKREDLVAALSFLAHAGHPSDARAAEEAFRRGAALLPGLRAVIIPSFELDPAVLPEALRRLAAADPAARERLLEASAACALSDGRVTEEEWESLRVFAAALECPLPPALSMS